MRNWVKTLLFLSAFSPTLFALAYVRYDIYGLETEVYQLLAVGTLGTILPALIVKLISTSREAVAFEAKKVESNDVMLLAFIGSYFLPIVARASDLNFFKTVVFTVVLIIVLWLSSAIPSHPILRFFKFRFYKVESGNGVVYTLISKREIRDPKTIKIVKQLSSSMLMEIRK